MLLPLCKVGPTKQQNGTKSKKRINQQNNKIFCYFIPKQQNEKPIVLLTKCGFCLQNYGFFVKQQKNKT